MSETHRRAKKRQGPVTPSTVSSKGGSIRIATDADRAYGVPRLTQKASVDLLTYMNPLIGTDTAIMSSLKTNPDGGVTSTYDQSDEQRESRQSDGTKGSRSATRDSDHNYTNESTVHMGGEGGGNRGKSDSWIERGPSAKYTNEREGVGERAGKKAQCKSGKGKLGESSYSIGEAPLISSSGCSTSSSRTNDLGFGGCAMTTGSSCNSSMLRLAPNHSDSELIGIPGEDLNTIGGGSSISSSRRGDRKSDGRMKIKEEGRKLKNRLAEDGNKGKTDVSSKKGNAGTVLGQLSPSAISATTSCISTATLANITEDPTNYTIESLKSDGVIGRQKCDRSSGRGSCPEGTRDEDGRNRREEIGEKRKEVMGGVGVKKKSDQRETAPSLVTGPAYEAGDNNNNTTRAIAGIGVSSHGDLACKKKMGQCRQPPAQFNSPLNAEHPTFPSTMDGKTPQGGRSHPYLSSGKHTQSLVGVNNGRHQNGEDKANSNAAPASSYGHVTLQQSEKATCPEINSRQRTMVAPSHGRHTHDDYIGKGEVRGNNPQTGQPQRKVYSRSSKAGESVLSFRGESRSGVRGEEVGSGLSGWRTREERENVRDGRDSERERWKDCDRDRDGWRHTSGGSKWTDSIKNTNEKTVNKPQRRERREETEKHSTRWGRRSGTEGNSNEEGSERGERERWTGREKGCDCRKIDKEIVEVVHVHRVTSPSPSLDTLSSPSHPFIPQSDLPLTLAHRPDCHHRGARGSCDMSCDPQDISQSPIGLDSSQVTDNNMVDSNDTGICEEFSRCSIPDRLAPSLESSALGGHLTAEVLSENETQRENIELTLKHQVNQPHTEPLSAPSTPRGPLSLGHTISTSRSGRSSRADLSEQFAMSGPDTDMANLAHATNGTEVSLSKSQSLRNLDTNRDEYMNVENSCAHQYHSDDELSHLKDNTNICQNTSDSKIDTDEKVNASDDTSNSSTSHQPSMDDTWRSPRVCSGPLIPLDPAITSARRSTAPRPSRPLLHLQSALLAAKKQPRDRMRNEKAIYVPRHRRSQLQGEVLPDSLVEDDRDARSAPESSGLCDEEDATEGGLSGDNSRTVDRRAMIMSFINRAGKDNVVMNSKPEEKVAAAPEIDDWEIQPDMESEPDLPTNNISDSESTDAGWDSLSGPHTNVLEIYGFGVDILTQHLRSILNPYSSSVDFKWVDDSHALAVFKTSEIAYRVYQDQSKLPFRVRHFKDASPASQRKLDRYPRTIGSNVDHKQRPVTTAAVANRLVGGALGITVRRTQEQITADRNKMQREREKRNATRQQAAIAQDELDAAFEHG